MARFGKGDQPLNLGYALLNDEGYFLPHVKGDSKGFSLQLYYYMASKFLEKKSLEGSHVLEISSGRG